METQVYSKLVFDGKIITVYDDIVQLDNNKTATREVVHSKSNAAAVLAFTDKNEVVFIRQFRYAIGTTILELPAGKLDPGEDPKFCVLRELKEETGYDASFCEKIGSSYGSVGYCTEEIHLYRAHNLTKGEARPEDDENIEIVLIPINQAVDMLVRGEFRDAKTQAALGMFALSPAGQLLLSKHVTKDYGTMEADQIGSLAERFFER